VPATGLELKDFRLHLEGKRFWGMLKKLVGSGLISTFKWTMHPLNIKPFMSPNTFPTDSTRFDTVRFSARTATRSTTNASCV
jgi:hypothetical protein